MSFSDTQALPPTTHFGMPFRRGFLERHPGAESVIALFDHLPSVLFYAKDTEHRYIGMNMPTLVEVFGLTSLDEILGRTDAEFQPPALAEAYHAEDRRVFDEGLTIANQVWLVPHVRGTPKWYVSTKTPLFDPNGDVIGLAGVMYPIATPTEQGAVFRELLPVIRHIDEHYTEPISMKEMAEQAGVSATSFNTRFREILRMTPSEYVLSRRIEHARRLLAQTSKSLAEIAFELGFTDQSHFTKRFRRITGLTPKDYRLRFR